MSPDSAADHPLPPAAERRRTERVLHGETVFDDYAWLRDREDPAVRAYLEAENAYTEAMTAASAELRERLFEEIRSRVQETDLSVPARRGDYWYSTRTEEGLSYPIRIRMLGGPDGPEEIVLDDNELAAGHEYFVAANVTVTPDQQLVAYSIDTDGSERYRTRFRTIATGEDLDDEIPVAYYGAAFANDSATYFYVVPDAAMRPWQVWKHRLGSPIGDDTLVYQEDDERFFVGVGHTRSRRFIVIYSESKVTSEAFSIPADDPETLPTSIRQRRDGVRYDVDHQGDHWYIVVDEQAPDGKLVRRPIDGGPEEVVIAHRPGVKLDAPDCFAAHVVVWGRAGGLTALTVVPADGAEPFVLEIEEDLYRIGPAPNYEFDTAVLRYAYESLVTPLSVYDHDLVTGERVLLKQTPVLGGYEAAGYEMRREWATAKDGALIPVSLVRRRAGENAPAPLLLYGYGSYEHSVEPRFSAARLSLLDRGVTFAIAHVRGGGEMGRTWYDAGRMEHKENTFTDFIAAAEHLIGAGYTTPARLAARGASAGGLLMGAVVNLRPDLFSAVVAEVPFVDVVNTMLDETLPLTVVEWEEWGNPRDAEQYRWLRRYSPYENVAAGDLPALLVTAGLNDPRVQFWEPAKWVALIRTVTNGERRTLLKTEMGAGHGGRSGRYDAWRDEAFVMAFLIEELGVA